MAQLTAASAEKSPEQKIRRRRAGTSRTGNVEQSFFLWAYWPKPTTTKLTHTRTPRRPIGPSVQNNSARSGNSLQVCYPHIPTPDGDARFCSAPLTDRASPYEELHIRPTFIFSSSIDQKKSQRFSRPRTSSAEDSISGGKWGFRSWANTREYCNTHRSACLPPPRRRPPGRSGRTTGPTRRHPR